MASYEASQALSTMLSHALALVTVAERRVMAIGVVVTIDRGGRRARGVVVAIVSGSVCRERASGVAPVATH